MRVPTSVERAASPPIAATRAWTSDHLNEIVLCPALEVGVAEEATLASWIETAGVAVAGAGFGGLVGLASVTAVGSVMGDPFVVWGAAVEGDTEEADESRDGRAGD